MDNNNKNTEKFFTMLLNLFTNAKSCLGCSIGLLAMLAMGIGMFAFFSNMFH